MEKALVYRPRTAGARIMSPDGQRAVARDPYKAAQRGRNCTP